VDFDRQPTLQGARFRLRPLQTSDRDAFIAVAGDPSIWEEHPESDRATPGKLEQFFADALASGGALVVTTPDGEVVGSSRFEEPDDAGDRILIDHAFTAFDTIELRVGVDNARTRGAIEDFLGATYVDTVSTTLGDHAVYELSRDAWAQRA
jgi:RimJ/RimL family protein N-acetyltransferase